MGGCGWGAFGPIGGGMRDGGCKLGTWAGERALGGVGLGTLVRGRQGGGRGLGDAAWGTWVEDDDGGCKGKGKAGGCRLQDTGRMGTSMEGHGLGTMGWGRKQGDACWAQHLAITDVSSFFPFLKKSSLQFLVR